MTRCRRAPAGKPAHSPRPPTDIPRAPAAPPGTAADGPALEEPAASRLDRDRAADDADLDAPDPVADGARRPASRSAASGPRRPRGRSSARRGCRCRVVRRAAGANGFTQRPPKKPGRRAGSDEGRSRSFSFSISSSVRRPGLAGRRRRSSPIGGRSSNRDGPGSGRSAAGTVPTAGRRHVDRRQRRRRPGSTRSRGRGTATRAGRGGRRRSRPAPTRAPRRGREARAGRRRATARGSAASASAGGRAGPRASSRPAGRAPGDRPGAATAEAPDGGGGVARRAARGSGRAGPPAPAGPAGAGEGRRVVAEGGAAGHSAAASQTAPACPRPHRRDRPHTGRPAFRRWGVGLGLHPREICHEIGRPRSPGMSQTEAGPCESTPRPPSSPGPPAASAPSWPASSAAMGVRVGLTARREAELEALAGHDPRGGRHGRRRPGRRRRPRLDPRRVRPAHGRARPDRPPDRQRRRRPGRVAVAVLGRRASTGWSAST